MGNDRLDADFGRLLVSHDLEDLRAHSGAVYGLWADLRIAFLNPSWFVFAQANGGEPVITDDWGLGQPVLDAMSPAVRRFYADNYGACLASGEVWSHEYECSSAVTHRKFRQVVYPLGQREGLLVANSIILEGAHEATASPADATRYENENGLIHQCSHCRRVESARDPGRWDWVPEWVTRFPENTSHGICPPCFGFYYPLPMAKAD